MNAADVQPVVRRRLSFSLRALLIVAPLVAIAASLAFRAWYADYLQERAVAEVQRLGGEVARDAEQQVVRVELAGKSIDDEQLAALVAHFRSLPKLKTLVLASNDI